jgi:hypothetical protein
VFCQNVYEVVRNRKPAETTKNAAQVPLGGTKIAQERVKKGEKPP